MKQGLISTIRISWTWKKTPKKPHFYDVKYSKNCAPLAKKVVLFENFYVHIFVRLLAKLHAHLSLELLNTLANGQ